MQNYEERRVGPRHVLPVGYTPVAVRRLDEDVFTLEGHAYDISAGGVQFELDQGIEPGTQVVVRIHLPTRVGDVGPGRAVFAFGNVVWNDDEDVGPVRLAVAFTRFARSGDEERLMRQVGHQTNRAAA